MERLLQTFEAPFVDANGNVYDVHIYGQSRPGDTWIGWLVFTRRRDGAIFSTATETTQSSAEAVLYWATGLTDAYFDGAFNRAQRKPAVAKAESAVSTPPPLRDVTGDRETYLHRLSVLQKAILACFKRHETPKLRTNEVMAELPYSHADVVRALEDLEKQRRLITRRTDSGSDWVNLTTEGAVAAGVEIAPRESLDADRLRSPQ